MLVDFWECHHIIAGSNSQLDSKTYPAFPRNVRPPVHHCLMFTHHGIIAAHRLCCPACTFSIVVALTPSCTTNLDIMPRPCPLAVHSSHLGLPACRCKLGSKVMIKLPQYLCIKRGISALKSEPGSVSVSWSR